MYVKEKKTKEMPEFFLNWLYKTTISKSMEIFLMYLKTYNHCYKNKEGIKVVDNKTNKLKLKEIFQNRLNENKSLPQKQQFEHIVSKEIIDSDYKYERTTKKLMKLEIGLCPECDNTTYCIDYNRGERVCPQCGYVFSNTVFERPRFKPVPKDYGNIRDQRYMKFTNNKKYLYATEAKEWKKRQIQREIDVVSTSLQMSHYNKKRLYSIIEDVGLKKLHHKANMTTIICAVARYLLINQENKPLVQLRYDRGIFKENLSRQEYIVVEKNIINLFGDKYAYRTKTKKKKKTNTAYKNKMHSSDNSRRTKQSITNNIRIRRRKYKN